MSVQYGIAGYVIGGTKVAEGMYLIDGTEYAPALSPRRAVVELPRTHYSVPMFDDPLSEITVGLTVRVQGRDAESLRNYWNILTGLLGMGGNRAVDLTRHRGDNVEFAEGQLVSTTTPDFSCPQNRADSTIVLSIPQGAWRGPYTEQTFSAGAARSLDTAVESTRPITDAMIRVPGPLTSMQITDVNSVTGLQWGGGSQTVSGSQFLLVDCLTMQAKIQSSASWDISSGTQASGTLVYTGVGPLSIVSRWQGPIPTTTSSLTIALSGGASAMSIRSRKAVV